MIGQLKIDGWNRGNCINPQRFGMAGQLLRISSVVAGNMGNDNSFAAYFFHNGFKNQLALFYALVDTFAGRASDIEPLYALLK